MKTYLCKECDLHYESEELAQKCFEWCKTHNTCNLQISKQSLEARKKAIL